jgi:hypothetical protein
MGIFSLFFLNCGFILIFVLIYILGITIGHLLIEEITRDRKRPKKIFINSSIAREVFNRQHRKQLEIPLFINYYNYYINSVDIAN